MEPIFWQVKHAHWKIVGAEFIRNIRSGEVVIIDESGYRIEKYTENISTAIAAMEYVYFARPDSDISGVNVHKSRKRCGRRLAQEAPVEHADIIMEFQIHHCQQQVDMRKKLESLMKWD